MLEGPDAIRANLPTHNVELVARRNELMAAFNRVPESIDHEQAARDATDFVKLLRALETVADIARVEFKAPYLTATRLIDAFYAGEIIEPVETARHHVEKRLSAYQDRANLPGPVRGEYGAVASTRQTWEFTDLDPKQIDLETLRAFFTKDCLARAVRNFIRAGNHNLTGVKIYPASKTVVR